MQTFAILMAILGVAVAFVYNLSSWSVFLIVSTLVLFLFGTVAILWRNPRQINWKKRTPSE